MTNSRWYSGTGIYRDVYLLESGLDYLVPGRRNRSSAERRRTKGELHSSSRFAGEVKDKPIPAEMTLHTVIRKRKR